MTKVETAMLRDRLYVRLLPALRQYRLNNDDSVVAGYDDQEVNVIIESLVTPLVEALLAIRCHESHAYGKSLTWLVANNAICEIYSGDICI